MDENEKPESRLDQLQQDLYSRKREQVAKRTRRDLKERDFGVRDEWKKIETEENVKQRRPVIKLILIASLAFFAFSAVFASYFFFQGVDISPKNVVIEVQGPALIGGGETLDLQIGILNNNPVPIETADLIVEYPDGTRSAQNIDVDLPRHRESLGTIDPGEQIRKNIEAVLFGEENSTKEIHIVVEYRVSGSNAIFIADSTYELALASSPLSLVVEALEETVSGQEIGFTATVKSNSSSVVRDAMLEVEYPFGFDFQDSDPEPFFANKVWYLGDIPPEEEVKVTLRGILSGQDGEERVFRFSTGLQSENDENEIGARFINIAESVFIKRPFISSELALTGDTKNGFAVAERGVPVVGEITWKNNLSSQIFDGEIEVEFSGSAVDEQTITSNNGFYRSFDNKIIWNGQTEPSLGSITAGESGIVSFTFKPLSLSSGVPLKNPIINLDVTVRGKRLSDNNVPEEIVSTLSKQVKVATDLILTSKALHFTGPFQNTGPMPPKVDQETTYTVVLSVINSSNDVANGTVSMTLPPYVEWLGNINPLTEEITYTPVGGQIVWNVGEIAAGTGRTLPAREIAFQIKLLPSITQVDKSPVIVNSQRIAGFDRFTEKDLESFKNPLDINLSESGFNPDLHDAVVP